MIIYKITNKINGKSHIGQTVRTLDERMSEHKRCNKIIVDKAIRKYGIENFKIEEIDSANCIDELKEKEVFFIKHFNTIAPNGYNQCVGGGSTSGFKHTNESKQKMSNRRKSLYAGERNPFYNKFHSEESKRKMSESRKGMKHLTDEQVQNLRLSHYKVRVMCVETSEEFESIKDAAEKYGIKATHITRVLKGNRKTCGGFHWKQIY